MKTGIYIQALDRPIIWVKSDMLRRNAALDKLRNAILLQLAKITREDSVRV